MELTDKEYVERCRDGSPDDFGRLVQRYQKPLFVYVAGRLSDPVVLNSFLGMKKHEDGKISRMFGPGGNPPSVKNILERLRNEVCRPEMP